jgi:hypothetical protein
MPITYPLSLPTVRGPARAVLTGQSVTAMTQSPFTGQQQVQVHPAMFWRASVELASMSRAEAELWSTFLLKLRGRAGTFLMGDPNAATARGSASTAPGTPLVKGAGQTGQSLVLDGAPASAAGYLMAGDYIQIGSAGTARLYKVLDDAGSNSDGEVTLSLWPRLRTSPADDAAVVVSGAAGLWRLTSDGAEWEERPGDRYNMRFEAMEALS